MVATDEQAVLKMVEKTKAAVEEKGEPQVE